jgi:hypothetical protein
MPESNPNDSNQRGDTQLRPLPDVQKYVDVWRDFLNRCLTFYVTFLVVLAGWMGFGSTRIDLFDKDPHRLFVSWCFLLGNTAFWVMCIDTFRRIMGKLHRFEQGGKVVDTTELSQVSRRYIMMRIWLFSSIAILVGIWAGIDDFLFHLLQ